eukprot:CAMPEP_0116895462 /NCGR_PEP_ID=MMETSP0467-20121206/4974_1 /TAXON_ID=283647 /ORGANISM="Mesodinium pulex, Strain SPMC105" /LENGTH=75 /DNA_ID=CAMNT_0004566193 /DNA_START=198 /DNA_END=423 /DNA_ORIENTATION=-
MSPFVKFPDYTPSNAQAPVPPTEPEFDSASASSGSGSGSGSGDPFLAKFGNVDPFQAQLDAINNLPNDEDKVIMW